MPVRRIWTAAFGSSGIFKVRLKSPPVPSGSMARRLVVGMGAPLWKKPLTTSLSVPSPPTATITGRESLTARSAICVASSGRVVSTASYGIPVEGSHVVIADHSRPARPAPEAGLTMKSTSATLPPASKRVRVHDPSRIDCLFNRPPDSHPPSHLVGDPPRPHLTGAGAAADVSAKLQLRVHPPLPASFLLP